MSTTKPLVGVCMGSTTDLKTMRGATEVLAQFKIPFEVRVLSAHRTPQAMADYATAAAEAGLEVIIAGAGGAAHLPGMMAAMTTLPVVGVPVAATKLDGMDALLSIVQMPRGTPVATVAIGNAANAAHLAARILATSRPELSEAIAHYQQARAKAVQADDEAVRASKGDKDS